MVQKNGQKAVEMFSDLQLVVGQVKRELKARDARMREYLSQVKRLQLDFDLFSLSHVPRSGNTHVDSLATLTTSSAGDLPRVILVEHLERANEVAKGMVHIHQVGVGSSWMDPIVRFLKDDVLPEEKSEVEKVQRNASILDHTYCVSTLRHQSYCLKSYTKGSVGVTQEEDLCHTEPSPGILVARDAEGSPRVC